MRRHISRCINVRCQTQYGQQAVGKTLGASISQLSVGARGGRRRCHHRHRVSTGAGRSGTSGRATGKLASSSSRSSPSSYMKAPQDREGAISARRPFNTCRFSCSQALVLSDHHVGMAGQGRVGPKLLKHPCAPGILLPTAWTRGGGWPQVRDITCCMQPTLRIAQKQGCSLHHARLLQITPAQGLPFPQAAAVS